MRFESSSSRRKNINLGVLNIWFPIQDMLLALTNFFQLRNANNTYLMWLLWKLNEIVSMKVLYKLQISAVIFIIILPTSYYLYCSKYYNCSEHGGNILILIIQTHSWDHLLLFYYVSRHHFILILSIKLHFGQCSV